MIREALREALKCKYDVLKQIIQEHDPLVYIRNLSSSTALDSAAKFSSELLLFIPEGIPIPTQLFLLLAVIADVKS
jgi:hypothetical protein